MHAFGPCSSLEFAVVSPSRVDLWGLERRVVAGRSVIPASDASTDHDLIVIFHRVFLPYPILHSFQLVMSISEGKKAWAALVTRPSYIPGTFSS